MTIYREIRTKSALAKTTLPGLDYSLNPYFGCSFACSYCYARRLFLLRGIDHSWGSYVEVKTNYPELLAKEIRRLPRDVTIGLGTATDPYQPVEATYRVTREVLEVLMKKRDLHLDIQTKSTLIVRDLDVIKAIPGSSVGFTLLTIDEDLTSVIEPNSPSPKERIEVLSRLSEEGVNTWIFIGPILPWLTDEVKELKDLIELVAESGVKSVLSDRLRMRPGVRESLVNALKKVFPEMAINYGRLVESDISTTYFEAARYIEAKCKELGLDYEDVAQSSWGTKAS